MLGQPLDHVHDHRPPDHGQHLLGDLVGQRPEPGPLTADEDYSVHQPVVVVLLTGLVVVVLTGLVVAVLTGLVVGVGPTVVVVVEVLVVVVVVWDLRNAVISFCAGGHGTEVPLGTKANMNISPLA